jgi:hypothetical protein
MRMHVHYLRTSEHARECTQARARRSFIVSKSSVHCLFEILSSSYSLLARFSFLIDRN